MLFRSTLSRLESVFAHTLGINRHLPPECAPALGRYDGDAYFGGGAWYVATLAAAEFCYRAALRCPAPATCDWLTRGDAFVATVRRYTPDSGDLSEQIDRDTGEQRSAQHLTWSYAAFITCIAARGAALRN